MTVPDINVTRFAEASDKPLLVVGPSLGTSVAALWGDSARYLGEHFDVIGWDLPGHGSSTPSVAAFDIADLAAGVVAAVRRARPGREAFFYAGVSVGGAVGLQLLLDVPDRIEAAIVLCTGAKIGESNGWCERAAVVRRAGTASMVEGSIQRWFAPGFVDRAPTEAHAVLQSLRDADDESYALVCEALGNFDVRLRLADIATPVLAVAGAHDAVTTTASLTEIADGVHHGNLAVLGDVAHLAALENPTEVARLVEDYCSLAVADEIH